jgi:hypothetical protein
MTRIIFAAMLVIALPRCSTQDEIEVRECQKARDVPEWDRCIEQHNARYAARKAQHDANDDSGAAMLLLGGTAFLNGYTQPRPVTTTCFTTGMMTQCTSP